MYKGFAIWFDAHPEKAFDRQKVGDDGVGVINEAGEPVMERVPAHPTQHFTAGGFAYLRCDLCHVAQTIDEVDALMRHEVPVHEGTTLFVAPSDGHVHAGPKVVKTPGPVQTVEGAA